MCENDYEEVRRRNMLEHKQMLTNLGLLVPIDVLQMNKQRSSLTRVNKSFSNVKVKRRASLPARYSNRLKEKDGDSSYSKELSRISDCDGYKKVEQKSVKRENSYGHIEGVNVGDWWLTRMECSYAGIHRPTVSGIHVGPEGAYSVALSGNYEDDVDYGDCFTYTGSGGRNLKGTKANPKNLRTAPQSRDQTADGANGSLILNIGTRRPVRVIRGYKLQNQFAPEQGYRYDGLYTVEKYWTCVGLSGFLVYKFRMKRCSDQDSAPWETPVIPKNQVSDMKVGKCNVMDDDLNFEVSHKNSLSSSVTNKNVKVINKSPHDKPDNVLKFNENQNCINPNESAENNESAIISSNLDHTKTINNSKTNNSIFNTITTNKGILDTSTNSLKNKSTTHSSKIDKSFGAKSNSIKETRLQDGFLISLENSDECEYSSSSESTKENNVSVNCESEVNSDQVKSFEINKIEYDSNSSKNDNYLKHNTRNSMLNTVVQNKINGVKRKLKHTDFDKKILDQADSTWYFDVTKKFIPNNFYSRHKSIDDLKLLIFFCNNQFLKRDLSDIHSADCSSDLIESIKELKFLQRCKKLSFNSIYNNENGNTFDGIDGSNNDFKGFVLSRSPYTKILYMGFLIHDLENNGESPCHQFLNSIHSVF